MNCSDCRALFSHWDADGNGVLSIDEVKEQLIGLGAGMAAAEADAEALMLLALDEEWAYNGDIGRRALRDARGQHENDECLLQMSSSQESQRICDKESSDSDQAAGFSPTSSTSSASPNTGRGITLHEFSRFVRKV